jgi:hypothetical protein
MVLDFTEGVYADASDLFLTGQTRGNIGMTGLAGVGGTRLTWSVGSYLLSDRYQMLLGSGVGGVQDLAGNALDGDGAVGSFPSGNGLPGGDWQMPLNVLVADVNGDGVVNTLDKDQVSLRYGATLGQPSYRSVVDINGDGVINVLDKALVATKLGTVLPAPLPLGLTATRSTVQETGLTPSSAFFARQTSVLDARGGLLEMPLLLVDVLASPLRRLRSLRI